ncbi:response regulator transcription factor [Intestinirhabdus alba]|jgi:two-component system alkaline phosphatase synthesis response regulator PhoP|uniref:Response regulator n=1 Tax=Intestinirhabdus alba TaxID=2899544 RepID=A0A6L6IND9_9ENTR|nr:response regulator transcription factor [Intestinirhabdus alba]MTH47016.1 response regulator [Intestinirhabdus alba]
MKILIAEDDVNIRQGLVDALSREGYTPVAAPDGRAALVSYHRDRPDFVLLDIMMPEMDGYAVCREIRRYNEHIPIVFLSAKDEEIDRVIGLELGADDYISKPFGIHELRARIKTIARRCLHQNAAQASHSFPFGDLTVFPNELRARRGEEKLELTLREVRILSCLEQHKNQVVTRDMLFDAAWGYDYVPNSRTLDQHISRLRKVIERDANHPQLIRTVHGLGYRYGVS